MVSDETWAFGPSFHVISSAARPRLAAQVWSPITATSSSRTTTWRTPESALVPAFVDMTDLSAKHGLAASVANFRSGGMASMP